MAAKLTPLQALRNVRLMRLAARIKRPGETRGMRSIPPLTRNAGREGGEVQPVKKRQSHRPKVAAISIRESR